MARVATAGVDRWPCYALVCTVAGGKHRKRAASGACRCIAPERRSPEGACRCIACPRPQSPLWTHIVPSSPGLPTEAPWTCPSSPATARQPHYMGQGFKAHSIRGGGRRARQAGTLPPAAAARRQSAFARTTQRHECRCKIVPAPLGGAAAAAGRWSRRRRCCCIKVSKRHRQRRACAPQKHLPRRRRPPPQRRAAAASQQRRSWRRGVHVAVQCAYRPRSSSFWASSSS